MEVAKGLPDLRDSFDKYTHHLTESVINRRSRLEDLKLVIQNRQVAANTGRLYSHEERDSVRRYGKGHGRELGRELGRGTSTRSQCIL